MFLPASAVLAEVPVFEAHLLSRFDTVEARQGIAVDGGHFYAIDNTRITKYDKVSGEVVLQWKGDPEAAGFAQLVHLDSASIHDGRIYAAHSNYPGWPMSSSVEVWDAGTLQHLASHHFALAPGSFTWMDFHAGYWWGTFANYDIVQESQTGQQGQATAYGSTAATTLVKMAADFTILQQWRFPAALLERFTPMSNSGGSWGPDGYLYLTGHDHSEVYIVRIPDQDTEILWLATVEIPQMEGQGIAWDRTAATPVLWAISRKNGKALSLAMPLIDYTAGTATLSGNIP